MISFLSGLCRTPVEKYEDKPKKPLRIDVTAPLQSPPAVPNTTIRHLQKPVVQLPNFVLPSRPQSMFFEYSPPINSFESECSRIGKISALYFD